jgi:membrane-associated phospholipid phosphatase
VRTRAALTLAAAALILTVAAPAAAQTPTPFLQSVKQDFKTFFTSPDTARTLIVFGTGALSVGKWDEPVTGEAHADWPHPVFAPGQTAGNFLVHAAAAGGTYAFGRLSGQPRVERLGSGLLRAQILSQSVIQASKYAVQRHRPDGSSHTSMPSGHSASAFAAATVLRRELGWKVGVPAYAFAAWVAASRMEANRHYLSDVVMGAGIGIAAGHAVTWQVGQQKLDVGVAPTAGGAAVTFTTH